MKLDYMEGDNNWGEYIGSGYPLQEAYGRCGYAAARYLKKKGFFDP